MESEHIVIPEATLETGVTDALNSEAAWAEVDAVEGDTDWTAEISCE